MYFTLISLPHPSDIHFQVSPKTLLSYSGGRRPPLSINTSHPTVTVAQFCQDRYEIDIDQYAKIISGEEARPAVAIFDFDLAIFAFSQKYDEVRVSLLCPQEKKTKLWKIWDFQRDKPGISKVHLTLGDLGDRRYISLVNDSDHHVYEGDGIVNVNDNTGHLDESVSDCMGSVCVMQRLSSFPVWCYQEVKE